MNWNWLKSKHRLQHEHDERMKKLEIERLKIEKQCEHKWEITKTQPYKIERVHEVPTGDMSLFWFAMNKGTYTEEGETVSLQCAKCGDVSHRHITVPEK